MSPTNKLLVSLDIQSKDAKEDTEYLKGRFGEIRQSIRYISETIDEYVGYCAFNEIRVDISAILAARQIVSSVLKQLDCMKDIDLDPRLPPTDYGIKVTDFLQKYRTLLNAMSNTLLILDTRSPSYDQSTDAMFFALDNQKSHEINYNRYRSTNLIELEKHFAGIFSLDNLKYNLFMTSSGMAAYNLIESYLLRYVLKQDDLVFIPHYIYFETYEQISRLPLIKVKKSNIYDTNQICEFILKNQPRVVFLDPITNTSDLRIVDIKGIIKKLEAQKLTHEVYIVIDGSMVSGEMLPLPRIKNEKVKILYYESCNKYLQLGLDISMGGFVVIPVEIAQIIRRLRTNTGTILYDNMANVFPRCERVVYRYRIKRFSRNALLIGRAIGDDRSLSRKVRVHYPTLKSHPDHILAQKCNLTGGLLTFTFNNPLLTKRDSLNKFIDIALSISKEQGVSLTKGLSFGFSLPRIFASSAQPENNNALPYLRLSVGDRSYHETILLASVLLEAFKSYTSGFNEDETI